MSRWCSVRVQSNNESAIEAVRLGVAAYREGGKKTPHALDLIAPDLGISRRRANALCFREPRVAVTSDERHRIRMGLVRALRRIADYLRDRADHWDAVADAQELSEKQLVLRGLGEWPSGNVGLQKHAA
jgi:hypothetical protein